MVQHVKVHKGGYKPNNIGFLRKDSTMAKDFLVIVDNLKVLCSETYSEN